MLTSGRWAPRPPGRQHGGDGGGGDATHELRGDRQRHENRKRNGRSGEKRVGTALGCPGAGGTPNAGPDADGSWCCALETLVEKKKLNKKKYMCVDLLR